MLNETTKYKLLIVDDETANLRLLERLFRGTYEIVTAASGPEALDLLAVHDISLIISDQRMPGMTGIEFLKLAAGLRPQTVRIMLTGYSDAEALVEAINSGSVYKYITKPWVNEELLQSAKRALQHYETMRAQRQLQITNERLQARLKAAKDSMVEMVSSLLREMDPAAPQRALQIGERAMRLGRVLELDDVGVETLWTAGYLYEAWRKAPAMDAITAPEPTPIAKAIKASMQVLSSSHEFEEVFALLSYAGEQFDGSGHPNGFQGKEIPIGARIVAAAFEYERAKAAQTGADQLSQRGVYEHLRSLAGTQLDPEIVDAICESAIAHVPDPLVRQELSL